MKKIVKLTESDFAKIIERVILEQGQEKIEIQPKELKSFVTPQKAAEIKSQANALSKNTEMIKQTLMTLRMADPEAYYMFTNGKDPLENNRTLAGDAVILTSLISLIYTIVQEIKGN